MSQPKLSHPVFLGLIGFFMLGGYIFAIIESLTFSHEDITISSFVSPSLHETSATPIEEDVP